MKMRRRKHRTRRHCSTRTFGPALAQFQWNVRWTGAAASALLTTGVALAQVPPHSGLPNPCAAGAVVCKGQGFDRLGTGSTLNYGANSLTINQNASSAIFNWQSFNINPGNSVQFVQPSTSAVALNRIYDPNVTTINGLLTANGQIYLINPNGLLFGPNANVNVGGLIASTMNLSNKRITSGLLYEIDTQFAKPVFTNDPVVLGSDPTTTAADMLTPSANAPQSIVVQPGATLYAAGRNAAGTVVSAGRIFLFAPDVENGGSIHVDGGGQVLLAAGADVYLGSSTDPSLRGLLVEVAGSSTSQVSIDPTGQVFVNRGNITLMGLAVNQAGKLTATSALEENGSIRLIARSVDPNNAVLTSNDPSVLIFPNATGHVNVESGSQTVVRLDPNDTSTLPLNDPTAASLRSTIDIEGGSVDIGGNGAPASTLIEAHGGNVTVTARQATSTLPLSNGGPQQYNVGDGSLLGTADPAATVNVGADAMIDVSGLQHVAVDGARNFVFIDRLTSNNLANAPYQRTGFLLGQGVYVNLARAPSWLDVSNLQAAVAGTQAERNATAGTIALRAEGSVNLAKGSVLDVSGGSVDYSAALGRTSQLITATGAVVDISNASADTQYIGFADQGSVTSTDPREGVSQTVTWQAPRIAQVGGYTAGKDAGTVEIYAPAAQLDGTMLGQVTTSPQQRATPPAGGQLKIGSDNATSLDTEAGISRSNILLGANATDLQQAASGLSGGSIEVNTTNLTAGGFNRLDLTSDGEIRLLPGSPLNLGPGGQFVARGNAIVVDSSLQAPGGSVALSERPLTPIVNNDSPPSEAAQRDLLSLIPATSALRGSVSFGTGVSLDVAGLWTNDFLLPIATVPDSPVVLNGGSISISARNVDVSAARFDVSSGAQISQSGVFNGGAGGSLSIRATYVDPNAVPPTIPDNGVLNLGSDFASRITGYGVTSGGSLSIGAPSIQLGGAAASVVVDPAVGSRGFQSFALTGYDNADVVPGVLFAPHVQYIQANPLLELAPSSSSVLAVATPTDPLPGRLAPVQISLKAGNVFDGTVNVGTGAVLDAGTGGSIALTAGADLYVDGTLRAKAGMAALSLIDRSGNDINLTPSQLLSRSLQLGPDASIDVSGTSATTVSPLGIKTGQVLDGGSVSLDANEGALTVASGAAITARGSSDTIDILLNGTLYQPQLIASKGGTVELSATTGLSVDGTIKGGGGSAGVDGGNLSVSLNLEPQLGPFLPNDTTSILTETVNLSVGQAPAGANAGQISGQISVAQIDSAGFDHVWLGSADQITFWQPTTLTARSSLFLAAPSLQAENAASVNLQAPYVALGTVNQVSFNNRLAAATGGAGSLTVDHARQIDLMGDISLLGIGQATLTSAGDVRGIGQIPLLAPSARQSGLLQFGGNLTISAAQLYPATQTDFAICSVSCSAPGSGGVQIVGNPQAPAPLAPLSAGGSLTFQVGDFQVGDPSATGAAAGGRVVAPLGSISVDASHSIVLAPGAVVSVSGTGLVPYGSVEDGSTWTYGAPNNNISISIGVYTIGSAAGAVVPGKGVSLNAPQVDVRPGSTINIAGGGDVVGTDFVAGPGGSYDMSLNFPYTNSPATRNPFFALVPSLGTGAAPFDPQTYQDLSLNPALPSQSASTFRFGQTITIGAGSALPAGTYTVLPPRYALLPGAFAVEPAAGYQDMSPTASVTMPDGTAIVAGKLGFAPAGTADARWSGYRVYSDAQFRTLSEFHDYLGSQFFAASASAAGQAIPRLGPDAGTLQLNATSTIGLAGAIDAQPAASGRGADIAIDAPAIQVAASPGNPAPSSTLVLSDAQLSGYGAETLVLGAVEQRNGSAATLANPAQSVTLQPGTALTAGEVMLAGTAVDVGSGASITALASQTPQTTSIAAIGDGATVYVGNVAAAPSWSRSVPTGTVSAGSLTVESNAVLSGASLIFDSTQSQSYAPSASLRGSNVEMSAPIAHLGDAPAGSTGLNLNQSLLSTLAASGNLTISSAGGIDVFGSVGIGTLDANGTPLLASLVLNGPGIEGMSSSSQLTVNAGHIGLNNNSPASQPLDAGIGQGHLTLNSIATATSDGSIDIGGPFSIGGFAGGTVLSASGRLQSASQTAAGTGELRFTGNPAGAVGLTFTDPGASLAIDANRITAQRGVNAAVQVPGVLTVAATGPVQAPQTSELGASLLLQAQQVDISGRIDLPAGVVAISTTGTTSADGITLEQGSSIRVAGVTQSFASTTADASAGSITLSSAAGSVVQNAGSVLDIQGAGTRGDAGTLNVSAVNGSVQLLGQLLSAQGTSARGADISIDAAQLSNFSALAKTINGGSGAAAADAISMRARTGNVAVAAGDQVRASHITLEADGGSGAADGSILVSGVLDASGASGGTIALYASNQTTVQAGGQLLARASAAGADGGKVLISSRVTSNLAAPATLDAINLGSGSLVDVSAGAGGNGGVVTLRTNAFAPGNAATADVEVAPIAGQVTGAAQVVVEGVQVIQQSGNVTLDGSANDPLANAAPGLQSYMNAMLANNRVLARLGATGLPLSLRPGLEIQATGSITVASPIDFATGLTDPSGATNSFTWRYGGVPGAQSLAGTVPGELTLRAAGNVSVDATISDGFLTGASSGQGAPAGTPNGTIWASGQSWSYTLTAGADLSSAAPNRTGANAADLTIGSPSLASPVVVRTGTGSIALSASQDVILGNGVGQQGNVVYTAGVADLQNLPTFPVLNTSPPGFKLVKITPTLTESGGDLTISAGRDVLGTDRSGVNQNGSLQTVDEWLLRGGSDTSAAPTVWWVYFPLFQQGFGALGGGNLAIDVGRDIVRVGAVVPSNGYDIAGTLTQHDAGSLSVSAGGTIQQGLYYDQAGSARLSAASLTSNASGSSVPFNGVRLAQGSGQFDIQVRESASFAPPFNPTSFLPGVTNFDRSSPAQYNTDFFTYAAGGSDGSFSVRSAASDVDVLGILLFGAPTLLPGGALGNDLGVLPPTFALTSFGGNVAPGNGSLNGETMRLYPSPSGQLQVLADGSISGTFFSMSQADPTQVPGITKPVDLGALLASAPNPLTTPIVSATPLHGNDPASAEIVARNGSITNTSFQIPKTTEVVAGGNIANSVFDIQNTSADSLTRIDAGGALDFSNPALTSYIHISGPGAAEIVSGGPMLLGVNGSGIESRGNLDNANLPALGASLIVAAGAGRNASGGVAFPDYLGLIDNFVRFDAFAAEGAQSATLNAQVLTALAKDPSLAPLVGALQNGLSNRASVDDPTSAFNQAIGGLTPSVMAVGAVKLASAVQVVANQQFVGSHNKDTFAPAYAVFGDLFPNLDNNAAAIRQFVLNNPFSSAPNPSALRDQVVQALPSDLAAVIRLGLAAPSTVDSADSAFSKALAALDPTRLAADARVLLARTLTVAGVSLDELRSAGQLTSAGSPYARELTALAAAYSPTTRAGLNDLNMDYNQIKVDQTGSIAIFAPQGSVIVGQSTAPVVGLNVKTPAQLGVFTIGGGDIIGMARDNFDVFRSRVFTIAGGDIDLWSSLGNIDAGRGARDVTVAAPPIVVVDPKTGLENLDFSGSVTGSGIGALETEPNQPPSNINLMAPAGFVDAGEAGIRAQTGTVTLGTNLVLNAGNIQAASGVSGGAVVATPPPPVPPSTNSSNADRTISDVQRDAIAQQQAAEQRAAGSRRMRVIGEFLGFEDECESASGKKAAGGAEADQKEAAKCPPARSSDKPEHP